MKKIISIIAATTLFFSLTSCDELTDLLSVTFNDVEIEQVINIPLVGDKSASLIGESVVDTIDFDQSIVLNMNSASNGENTEQTINNYLENLTDVSIDTISFTVLDTYGIITVPEDFIIYNITVDISTEADGLIYSETYNNIVVGTILSSNISTAQKEKIALALKDNSGITIRTYGQVNTGLSKIGNFYLKALIIADIKASALSTDDK